MREEEAKAQEKADAAKAIKDECEADLAEVGVLLACLRRSPCLACVTLWHQELYGQPHVAAR